MAITVATFESNDPYTQIEARLWESIDAHHGFSAMFPAANRIKWNGNNEEPDRRAILNGDTPHVTIMPLSGIPKTTENVASSFSDEFIWLMAIKTGQRRACASLFPIYFQFAKLMSTIGVNLMEEIGNLEFVTDINVGAVTFGQPGSDIQGVEQQGIQTWLMSAQIQTLIHIPADVMLEDT